MILRSVFWALIIKTNYTLNFFWSGQSSFPETKSWIPLNIQRNAGIHTLSSFFFIFHLCRPLTLIATLRIWWVPQLLLMDWAVFEEQIVSHSIRHPSFIHLILYHFQCYDLCLLFEASSCRQAKWWARFGFNFTCLGANYLYHSMPAGNLRWLIASRSGEPAFRLSDFGNLLTGPYMGGLASRRGLEVGKGLVSRNDPSRGVKINCM